MRKMRLLLTKLKEEELEEINVPAIVKSVISRMTHPKGYAMMLQKYVEMVKDGKTRRQNNRFYASRCFLIRWDEWIMVVQVMIILKTCKFW